MKLAALHRLACLGFTRGSKDYTTGEALNILSGLKSVPNKKGSRKRWDKGQLERVYMKLANLMQHNI